MKLKLESNGRYDLSWQTPKKISGCQEMLLRFTGDSTRRSGSSSTRQYPPAIEAFATRSSAMGWSRVAAAFGFLSIALLGASLRWAHHWGPRADAIVLGWAIATIGALAVSIPLLGATTIGKRLAKIGLVGGLVSVGALVLAGGLYAAGIDVAGACGGG